MAIISAPAPCKGYLVARKSCNLKVDVPQDLLISPQLPPRGVVLGTKSKSTLAIICVEISDPSPNAARGTRSQDNQWGGNSSQRDISVQFAAMTVIQCNFSSYSDTPRTNLRAKRYHRSRTPQGQVAAKRHLVFPASI